MLNHNQKFNLITVGTIAVKFGHISKQEFELDVSSLSTSGDYALSVLPTSSTSYTSNFEISSHIELAYTLQGLGLKQATYPNSNFFIGKYILPDNSDYVDLMYYTKGMFVDAGYDSRILSIYNDSAI